MTTKKLAPDDYAIITCSKEHLQTIIDMQNYVLDHLEDKQLLMRTNDDELEEFLRPPHFTLGVIHNGELIAYIVLSWRKSAQEKFYAEIDRKDIQPSDIAYVELVLVREDYRGNGLHKVLCRELERIVRERGAKCIAATASPVNYASVKSFEAVGLQIIKTHMTRLGFPRHMMLKYLE